MKVKKVFAVLGSTDLYGKERANINVYNLLKENNYKVYAYINKNASQPLVNELDGINILKGDFPNNARNRIQRLVKRFKLSVGLFISIMKVGPRYIMLCDEYVATAISLMLFFLPQKIIYRAGDELSFDKYGKKYLIYKFIWKRLIAVRINTLVCVSGFVLNSFLFIRSKKRDNRIIYNVLPIRNKKKIENQSFYNDKKDLNFGYIGRVDETKGCQHFIDAAIKENNGKVETHFFFAGKIGEDDFSNQLVEKVKPYHHKITVLGEIVDIEKFYKNIDVLIVPSIYEEPLANVVAEAKYYSVPSIIYPSGGLPEIVTHLEDGFICAQKKSGSLLDAISYYIDNPERVIEHGMSANYSLLEKGMSRDVFTQKWLSIFNK